MRRGLIVNRRNAHEARNFEAVVLAAAFDKTIRLLRKYACLLWFGAGIDLDVKAGMASGFLDLTSERLGDLVPVDCLDHIEKGNRFMRLVGLQGADEVEFETRVAGFERRPFFQGLL